MEDNYILYHKTFWSENPLIKTLPISYQNQIVEIINNYENHNGYSLNQAKGWALTDAIIYKYLKKDSEFWKIVKNGRDPRHPKSVKNFFDELNECFKEISLLKAKK